MKDFEIDEKDYGLKFKDGNIEYRLGNWTDAGWYWDGNRFDTLTFLLRIYNSSYWKEFKERMLEEGVKDLKEFFKDSIMDSIDDKDFYSLFGDNRIWYHNSFSDELYDKTVIALFNIEPNNILTDEQENKVFDIIYHININYDSFANWYLENNPNFSNELKGLFNEMNELDDFIDFLSCISNEIYESILEFIDNEVYEAVEKATAK